MKKVFLLISIFALFSLPAQAQSLSSQFLSDREYNKFVEDSSGNVAVRAVVSASNSPTDEDCLTYEATGSTTEWQSCGGAGVAYDDIADPDAESTIAFSGFTVDWTTNETASDFFNITNSGNFGDVSLMVIQATGNPTDGTMFEIINTDTDVDSILAPSFIVKQNGNTGVGTISPSQKLEVAGDALLYASAPSLRFEDSQGAADVMAGRIQVDLRDTSSGLEDGSMNLTIPIDGTHQNFLNLEGTAQEVTINQNGVDINFRVESVGDIKAFFVEGTNGNIGIGTSTPSTELHISNDNAVSVLRLERNDTTIGAGGDYGIIEFAGQVPSYEGVRANILVESNGDSGGTDMVFSAAGGAGALTEYMRIEANGYVGIGTSAPSGKLEVVQSSVSNLKINSSGELQGDPLADQMSYNLAGIFRDRLTAEKLLLGWITPATTEQDLSGNNHDATYNGTMTTGDQLNKGLVWSLDFDGTDDYLSIADSDDFSFGDGSTDSAFSVCGWVEVVNDVNSKTIASKWDATTSAEIREWLVKINQNEILELFLYDESANALTLVQSDSAISSGWRYVCTTYDGTGGATAGNGIVLYSNGVAVASTATNNASYVAMENLATPVWIGANEDSSGAVSNMFPGDMGQIFVTAEELTANDVQELYLSSCGYYNQCTIGF